VPWATLVRALGRFKLFLPEIRRDQLLAAYDPLALDEVPQPWAEQDTTSQKTFWGDHQQLSKVGTAQEGRGGQGRAHAVLGAPLALGPRAGRRRCTCHGRSPRPARQLVTPPCTCTPRRGKPA
jgi:hypothetical protein